MLKKCKIIFFNLNIFVKHRRTLLDPILNLLPQSAMPAHFLIKMVTLYSKVRLCRKHCSSLFSILISDNYYYYWYNWKNNKTKQFLYFEKLNFLAPRLKTLLYFLKKTFFLYFSKRSFLAPSLRNFWNFTRELFELEKKPDSVKKFYILRNRIF